MNNSSALDIFLKQFRSILYRRKERIVLPNENSDYVYYITQGFVTQSILSPNGNQFTPYIFAPNTFFPLIWSQGERINDAHDYEYESLTPVEVYRIPKEKLLSFLRETPKVTLILNEQLMNYSAGLLKKLETRVLNNAIHMVILRLLDLAKLFGSKQEKQVIINYWFTHQDIANISGLSREVVTIQMNRLMKKKLIGYKNHFIVVGDLELLEKELQSDL
jgi:CRP/FNR family transcriptional regulator, cyclic AMP receptor protein